MKFRPSLNLVAFGLLAAASPMLQAQCGGYERWAVKVGTDSSAASIDIAHPQVVSIQNLIAMTSPASVPTNNDGTRLASEKVVYTVTCRLVQFKQEGGTGDMDYHMVLSDDTLLFTDTTGANAGHSIVAESVAPTCISGSHSDGPATSTWQSQIVAVRNKINARFTTIPSSGWVDAKGVQVRVTGVCFFDPVHGQTGRTNGGTTGTTLELHPILDIAFLDTPANTVTASITAPAADTTVSSGTSVSFTGKATDSNSGATFTYSWNFGDGTTGAGASAAHTFTNTGTAALTRTVTFTATDNTGAAGSATRAITVNPATLPPPSTTFPEVEPNDTIATANVVGATVTKIVGYFPSSSDNDDYFAVTLAAGHTLTVDMTGPTASSQDYDLYLVTSTGSQLAKSEGSSTTEHVSYKNTSTTASKTIYINVHRYASYSSVTPYTLTLSR